MKHRWTAPLLAAATLLLVGANALPSIERKRVLGGEIERLEVELGKEEARRDRLRAEIEALRGDPFYLERVYLETWVKDPVGAVRFDAALRAARGPE